MRPTLSFVRAWGFDVHHRAGPTGFENARPRPAAPAGVACPLNVLRHPASSTSRPTSRSTQPVAVLVVDYEGRRRTRFADDTPPSDARPRLSRSQRQRPDPMTVPIRLPDRSEATANRALQRACARRQRSPQGERSQTQQGATARCLLDRLHRGRDRDAPLHARQRAEGPERRARSSSWSTRRQRASQAGQSARGSRQVDRGHRQHDGHASSRHRTPRERLRVLGSDVIRRGHPAA